MQRRSPHLAHPTKASLASHKQAAPSKQTAPKQPVEQSRHCVRCHELYTPSKNRGNSCVLEHDNRDVVGVHSNETEDDDGQHEKWNPEVCTGPHITQHQYDNEDKLPITHPCSDSECGSVDSDSEDSEEESEKEE
ncbi:hypothetical protein B0H17DRAFT_1197308 [Mycena rosella]|uniref:Uncharacterized protein n=1 Tax=Mycena rosella TaxID=1033263 RepID=A0AAD7DQX5_MYCRO|nr:hypothetical protein B0H17DRAFT_1197308 [Mycena rosella]